MSRQQEQNRRIATAMNHRLGRAPGPEKTGRSASPPTTAPRLYLCKCNHAIDLSAGFDQCPKCGSALQLTLPSPK